MQTARGSARGTTQTRATWFNSGDDPSYAYITKKINVKNYS